MIKQPQAHRLTPSDIIESGFRPTLISLAIIQSLSMPVAQAATINVTDFGDAGNGCTLRESIVSISQQFVEPGCGYTGDFGDNDKITIASGSTVNLTSTLPRIFRSTIIDGASVSGGAATIVGGGDYSDRVFIINGVAGTTVTLDSLVISGGNTSQGGGIATGGAETINLVNCTVTGNTANEGGAIYIDVQSTGIPPAG